MPVPSFLQLLALAVVFATPAFAGPYTPLSDASLAALLPPSDAAFDAATGSLLAPILIPRVPGTPGSLKVLTHFRDFFAQKLPEWQLNMHNSTSTTPTSKGAEVPFVNFMATRDPPWARPGEIGRLLLVAHYDSKLTPPGFIGATDSAVPCALLLHTAQAIDAALTKKWDAMKDAAPGQKADERGVMVLLLDGEEAFHSWTDTDSLYGARALAEHWDNSWHPASSPRRTELGNIDLFVLFDLLGAPSPRIPSYFPTTHWSYIQFRNLEQRLRKMGNKAWASGSTPEWFYEHENKNIVFNRYGVQDDHIPFLTRGVEILHLIPTPFPQVWHRMEDDGAHLDPGAVKDWARLTSAWTAGWLGLEGWLEGVKEDAAGSTRKQKRAKTEL